MAGILIKHSIKTSRMATETTTKTMNGNYGAHQPYGHTEPFQTSQSSTNSASVAAASSHNDDSSAPPATAASETVSTGEGNKPPSKDEVGWYFVESYYTTLSKNPETLYVR